MAQNRRRNHFILICKKQEKKLSVTVPHGSQFFNVIGLNKQIATDAFPCYNDAQPYYLFIANMTEEKQYLTKEKYQEFKNELEDLRTNRRKEVAENLEYAKKLGDLSENAEYQQAREEQASVEDRINHLEQVLKTAVILNDRHSDSVGIGSTVKVEKEGDKEARTYKIVGSEEADMAAGKVSNLSPLGAALIGKKKGEKLTVTTPKGKVAYSVITIE